jgi:hypothetical protein
MIIEEVIYWCVCGSVVRRVSSLELGRKKQGVEVRGVDGVASFKPRGYFFV